MRADDCAIMIVMMASICVTLIMFCLGPLLK